jgi:lipopolysaccharide/colanic/teichoic acid biosynthesis glycosyltransferase
VIVKHFTIAGVSVTLLIISPPDRCPAVDDLKKRSDVTLHPGEHQPHTRTARQRNLERRHSSGLELVHDDPAEVPERQPSLLHEAAKRLLDIFGALFGIIVLLPVFLLVAVVIKINSPGPVFFAHRRLGRDGRHFDCLKFRTMQVDAEHHVYQNEELRHHYVSNHFKIHTHLDPRITAVGRFLRKSSLDELPQLWNVLVGEMSLVGPRPIVALEATHYGDDLDELLSVRPGLTGLWAVEGRSAVGYPTRAEVELRYVRTRSLGTDLGILARTPWTVITQRGTV